MGCRVLVELVSENAALEVAVFAITGKMIGVVVENAACSVHCAFV